MAKTVANASSWLSRIIFGVALFGVLVVTHLWLQKEADFAYGCSGVAELTVTSLADAAAEEAGCAQVTNSAYADFLGVSNIVWGLLFYGALALLRLAYAATGNDRLRMASLVGVGAGFVYTLYLVFLQVSVIGAFCVLCMTSALTVTTLLVLHVLEHRRLRSAQAAPAPRFAPSPVLKPFLLVAAAFAVLLVTDVVVAQQRDGGDTVAADETPFGTAAPVSDLQQQPAETPPVEISNPAEQCTYDPEFAPIANLEPFTQGPYKGSAGGTVRVIEFFDPNCPHCRALHEDMREAIAENSEKARFYYVPFPLRDASFGQVAALYIAKEQGKFWDLVETFFARQDNTWGMTLDEIVSAASASGMDGAALRARLTDEQAMQGLLAQIVSDRTVAAEAISNADGGVSVPKLAIEGRIVSATYDSYSPACVTHFIDEALAAQGQATQ